MIRDDQRISAPDEVFDHRLATALLIAVLMTGGGVGFVVGHATNRSQIPLAALLALLLGCVAWLLALFLPGLLGQHQAVAQDRECAEDDLYEEADAISRRRLFLSLVLGAIVLVVAVVTSAFRSLAKSLEFLDRAQWKRGQRLTDMDGTPVSIDALREGSTMIVFPEGAAEEEAAQTILIRVSAHRLQLPVGREGWAPMGYVAYSHLCSRAGCTVGRFEPATHQLLCPCQSNFDVLRGGEPTDGPALRPLAQLPLYADADGILRAGGGFTQSA